MYQGESYGCHRRFYVIGVTQEYNAHHLRRTYKFKKGTYDKPNLDLDASSKRTKESCQEN
jgi:hypothetical protein